MTSSSRFLDAAALKKALAGRFEELLQAEHEELIARTQAAEREWMSLRDEIGEVAASVRRILSEVG